MVVQAPGLLITPETYVDYDGPPVAWLVLCTYDDSTINNPLAFTGVQVLISGDSYGSPRVRFNNLQSQTILAVVGEAFLAFGNKLWLQASLDSGAGPQTVNVWALPNVASMPTDQQRVPVDAGVPGIIPPFSCEVAADPPGQTIEVLDLNLAVVQTIALGGQMEFAPLDLRGAFMRNTALVNTLFVFKRKGFLG
jgi:hypothetical protein